MEQNYRNFFKTLEESDFFDDNFAVNLRLLDDSLKRYLSGEVIWYYLSKRYRDVPYRFDEAYQSYEVLLSTQVKTVVGIGGLKVEVIDSNPYKEEIRKKLDHRLSTYQYHLGQLNNNDKYGLNNTLIDWANNIFPFLDKESMEYYSAFFEWAFRFDDYFEANYNSMLIMSRYIDISNHNDNLHQINRP